MPTSSPLHLAVALDGTGWHPAAWREPAARPTELFSPGYWRDLVSTAERGLLDFVTIEDGLRLQSDDHVQADRRTDRVRGRLDATLIAARVAPVTSHIGLIPTVVANHTEPFHVSKAIATVDHASLGRAGVRVQSDIRDDTAGHFGRRPGLRVTREDALAPLDPETSDFIVDAFDEAADWVEVLRRLWDSWEDGAEIRDVATGRFLDSNLVHHIDFTGKWFSVKGPSITPRPPQGQPVVTALGHITTAYRLIARAADIGFITPDSAATADQTVTEIRTLQEKAGRSAEPLHVFADLVVFLDHGGETGADRLARLDDRAGTAYTSDAQIFAGSAQQLADLLLELAAGGLSGFRLRPGVLPDDLDEIITALVPELQRRQAFRTGYEADTLRGLLGLERPTNRYATAV